MGHFINLGIAPSRVVVRSLLAIVLGFFAFSPLTHADELPEMQEIISALADWKKAFANVRVVWKFQEPVQTDNASADEDTVYRTFGQAEWISADHGLDLYEHSYDQCYDQFRSLEVFNGPKDIIFAARYEAGILQSMEIKGLSGGVPASPKTRTPFTGMYFSSSALWLADALREWSWMKVEGIDEIDGHPCVHLTGGELAHSLWLDPEYDYLVRRLLTPRSKLSPGWEFTVKEYQQADNGRWFPKYGTMVLFEEHPPDSRQRWVVTELSVNDELDPKRFELPTLEVGARVTDMRAGRIYRVEHAGDRLEIEQKIRARAATSFPATAPAGSVSSQFTWLLVPLALIVGSIGLLSIALWMAKRSA